VLVEGSLWKSSMKKLPLAPPLRYSWVTTTQLLEVSTPMGLNFSYWRQRKSRAGMLPST
jgi:hypothetical protein